jgi:hypothetical protein
MIKGQKVKLEIGGYSSTYIFIGAGATAYAFKNPEIQSEVIVFIPDLKFKTGASFEDTTKDTLVTAFNKNKLNPYLPKIAYFGREFVGGPELDRPCKIYKMPFYRDIKKDDKFAWVEMKRLHKVRDDTMHQMYDIFKMSTGKKGSLTFLGNKAAKLACVVGKNKLNVMLWSALKTIYDNIKPGHLGVTFEFNRKNLGIDVNGHLILRDPVYDAEITVAIKNDRSSE